MMARGPDAGTLLTRALIAAGPAVTVVARQATPWASATFSGARHEMTLTAPASARLERWLAALPEADFTLRGHLVTDLVVTSVTTSDAGAIIRLEALTVED
ncbi:MAG: hypothetical protein ACTHMG_08350 [Sphingomonas sp.]